MKGHGKRQRGGMAQQHAQRLQHDLPKLLGIPGTRSKGVAQDRRRLGERGARGVTERCPPSVARSVQRSARYVPRTIEVAVMVLVVRGNPDEQRTAVKKR